MSEPLHPMTQKVYEGYLSNGYVEMSNKLIPYQSGCGRYVRLRKPVGVAGKVARMFTCVVCCPCLALTCCSSTSQNAMKDLVFASCDGYLEREGVIPDPEATTRLKREDFRSLGLNTKDCAAFIQKGDYPILKCPDYPHHLYVTFYGPATKLCYLIFIPFGKYDQARVVTSYNPKRGSPLNTAGAANQARILAAGYRAGVNFSRIREEKKQILVGSTNYGGALYAHTTRIVSE